MRRALSLIFVFSVTILFFQNCGKAPTSAQENGAATSNKSETVIGSAAEYKRIAYDPPMDLHLDLSLDSGDLHAQIGSVNFTCKLDADRLREARDILAASQICQPGPLPPGTAVCMAMGIPDVLLSNETSSVQLQPVICHNGTYLCDGNDARLRALLTDLRDHLPDDCASN